MNTRGNQKKEPYRIEWVEYMCRYCGAKSNRHAGSGYPSPGACGRRNGKPHIWRINRRY